MVASNYLVGPNFAGQVDNAQVWMELERRAQSGQLSAQKLEMAVQSLTGAMENAIATKATSWQPGQPLHWASRFLGSPAVARDVAPKTLQRLMELYDGEPTATAAITGGPEAGTVMLTLNFTNPSGRQLPLEAIWTASFYVDGQLTQPLPNELNGSAWSARAVIPLVGRGEHEIRVEFIRTYIPSSAGNGGFTTSPVKSWNVSKDYPLKTIPVTLKVTVP